MIENSILSATPLRENSMELQQFIKTFALYFSKYASVTYVLDYNYKNKCIFVHCIYKIMILNTTLLAQNTYCMHSQAQCLDAY